MRYRFPAYYSKFVCSGAECRDTCCKGWAVRIDGETYRAYRKQPGAVGRWLSAGIDRKNRCFRQKDGACAFLSPEGWCSIHRKLGRELVCRTCRDYPRHMEDYGELREVMLSLSCPDAAELILGDVRQGNWISKTREKEASPGVDARFLAELEDVRHTMICILRNRSVQLNERLAMVLAFGHDVQRRLGDGTERRPLHALSARYLAEKAPARFAKRAGAYRGRSAEQMIRTAAMVRDLADLEPVIPGWRRRMEHLCRRLYHQTDMETYARLSAEFAQAASALELEWENLALYFLHSYLLGAVYDGNVYGKVKLVIFHYLMIREQCLAAYQKTGQVTRRTLTDAAYRYSRETENSDANLDALEALFSSSGLYRTDSIMTVLLGAE